MDAVKPRRPTPAVWIRRVVLAAFLFSLATVPSVWSDQGWSVGIALLACLVVMLVCGLACAGRIERALRSHPPAHPE
jgi:hypothetical protein